MDSMIYISTSGAEQMLNAQQVHANNLANLKTEGFKADLVQLSSLPVPGQRLPISTFAIAQEPGTDFSAADIISTGSALDIAIKGEGWFAVQATDGSEAYTRNGSLQINQDGLLTVGNNLSILGGGGPIIIPPFEKIDIAGDGTITIIPQGVNAKPVILDRLKLVKPEANTLYKGQDGLIRTTTGGEAEPDASVLLASGFIEGSNVSAVEAITSMISIARQFEMQLKLVSYAEENDQASTSLLAIS